MKRRWKVGKCGIFVLMTPLLCVCSYVVTSGKITLYGFGSNSGKAENWMVRQVPEPTADWVHIGSVVGCPVFGDPDEIEREESQLELDASKTIKNVQVMATRMGPNGLEKHSFNIHKYLNMKRAELNELPAWHLELISLMVADGLPGHEGQKSVQQTMQVIRNIAIETAKMTHEDMGSYNKEPEKYGSSLARFKMCALITYLRQDFGIKYDKEWATSAERMPILDAMRKELTGELFWDNSQRLFLHGVVNGRGSCASLPVFTLVIGRQLGYPLKLVETRGHLFLRWEDENERFNIECTGEGFASYSDDYYREWPFEVTEKEVKEFGYLKSMSNAEELAVLCYLRSLCLAGNNRNNESWTWLFKAFELKGMARMRSRAIQKYHEQEEGKARATLVTKMMKDGRIQVNIAQLNKSFDANIKRSIGHNLHSDKAIMPFDFKRQQYPNRK